MMAVLLAAVGGYLVGAVPFGLVLTGLAGLGDIRAIGSGNIGATNVLRTGNKKLAVATLLLDGGKGAVAVLVAGLWGSDLALIAAAGAMLGHCFPVWLGFRGGKGVATAIGILLALAWPVGVAACLTWIATATIFRISSLAALVAVGITPVVGFALDGPRLALATLFIAVLVFFRHHANIRRLLRGEEPRIGKSGKAAS
ncbi:MAG: glycerol-3-phosphate 1-O-acyltransferase PlsY [Rhodospirillaceae bacterium]